MNNAISRQPLPSTHPEFTIHFCPGFREYRVENWHLKRDGSGRVVEAYSRLSWRDAALTTIIAILWSMFHGSVHAHTWLVAIFAYSVWAKCSQVLWESVIVIHPHGVQLETHKGYPSMPLYAVRRFIPAVSLQDFIINEGLRRWDIRYYMSAIRRTRYGTSTIETAYENILPPFAILLEVYREIHQTELVQYNAN